MSAAQHVGLTPAQRSIGLDLLEALSLREIADMREISIHTVRNHVAAIYRRLDAHSRAKALLWLVSHEACCLVLPWENT